jgi:uncharacterized spore protein YtfJ
MGRGTGTGMGMGTGRGTGTGRGRGTGRGTGKGRGTGRGMGREERPMKLAAYSKQGQTMILRIEIYEPLTEEQVEQIKKLLAEMGVKDITVQRFPETDQEEEDEYAPPIEPEEGDWITNDYKQWWEYNGRKIVVTDPDDWPAQMKEVMEREAWWPNLWYVGERGDRNLLDIHKGTFA